MTTASDRLLTYGGRLLFHHSQCLVVMVDTSGRLIEWNAGFERLLAAAPENGHLQQWLDPHSYARFEQLIAQTGDTQAAGPVMLHFADKPTAIPNSYQCRTTQAPNGAVVLVAEPLAPLDQQAAEQYILVINELALATRDLEKARYELEQKQRELEEALERVQQLAHIDELTQLLNRRSVMLRLNEETARARRYGSPCSIMLIDIDYFKQINDRYGHPAGDQVLRESADLLVHSIRSTDHLGRYGGEEFLAVLPMTGGPAAAELAERLRRRVASRRFTAAETVAFRITVSIGIAELDPERDTPTTLIAHADSALYQAKAQGRNRSLAWGA